MKPAQLDVTIFNELKAISGPSVVTGIKSNTVSKRSWPTTLNCQSESILYYDEYERTRCPDREKSNIYKNNRNISYQCNVHTKEHTNI